MLPVLLKISDFLKIRNFQKNLGFIEYSIKPRIFRKFEIFSKTGNIYKKTKLNWNIWNVWPLFRKISTSHIFLILIIFHISTELMRYLIFLFALLFVLFVCFKCCAEGVASWYYCCGNVIDFLNIECVFCMCKYVISGPKPRR